MRRIFLPLVCLVGGFASGLATRNSTLGRHFLDWLPHDVAASQERGNEVVAAIEAFHAANGVYPVGLEDLMPEFIDGLPVPVAGERCWRYVTDRAGSEYVLSFAFDSFQYPICTYSSERPGWKEDT